MIKSHLKNRYIHKENYLDVFNRYLDKMQLDFAGDLWGTITKKACETYA